MKRKNIHRCSKIKRFLLISRVIPTIIFLFPSIAFAYVDPGIVGMMFQAIFAFIFGTLFIWFAKPYKYFIKIIKKFKTLFRSNTDKYNNG